MDKLREVLRGEAEEYFEHNPKCKKVYFFILEDNDFDDNGDYEGYLSTCDKLISIENN